MQSVKTEMRGRNLRIVVNCDGALKGVKCTLVQALKLSFYNDSICNQIFEKVTPS